MGSIGDPRKEVFFTPLTPLHFLNRSDDVFPEKEAVVYDDKRYTYKQFHERVMRLAHGLKELGIQRGDKVAIISPNTPPMLEAHYGVPWIGASLVAINVRLSPKEICYIINHSDSKVLLLDTAFASTIESIKGDLGAVKAFINIVDLEKEERVEGPEYEEFLSKSSPSGLEIAVEDEYETIAIDYTSGTTGLPKGVMYHHRALF
jgi:fatty-acyl-CoA synthase